MKPKCFVITSAILVITGTVFSLPQRVVRSVGERPVIREHKVAYPHIAEPEDTLAYEDPDDIPNFMTLPNDYDDRYYNVRFTPPYAPFQIYAIHIPLFDMFGEQGTPGIEITLWESGEQDGENGYPTELIATIEVPFDDLEFAGADPVFNVIDISELNLTFNDEVEFHIAIDVIADEETDTLGIYMDDGEFVEDSRSGLFLGEDEEEEFPWIRIQDLEGMLPYNYAIHAVIGDPGDNPELFELALIGGWNLISSVVEPEDADIQTIFAELIEDSSLAFIRNSAGDFFDPMTGEGELAIWESEQAYQVKMYSEATIVYTGEFVNSDTEYLLSEGWNWLPYPRQDKSHPAEAFAAYTETIEIVKNNSGIFWSAGDSLNIMPIIEPGIGVMVKASAETEFTWAEPVGENDPPLEVLSPQHFAIPTNTGKNMSLLVTSWEDIYPGEGDELSLVNDEGMVFGSAVIQSSVQPIAVWCDDDTTPDEVDGFLADSSLHFVYYSSELEEDITVYGIDEEGDPLTYAEGSFIRITISLNEVGVPNKREAFRNEDFQIISLFPNPFNQSSQLEFNVGVPTNIKLIIWSIDGRLLKVLRSGYYAVGSHSVTINAMDFSAGTYILGLQSKSNQIIKPIILLP